MQHIPGHPDTKQAPVLNFRQPRCSFCIITYNQEKYIGEAVAGALSQNYEGEMEIIISDDCSRDNTFDIVRSIISAYSGSRKIILNRNQKNLGISGNVNKCFELASGEWIVMGGGDDVSLPDRVAVLMAEAARNPELRGIGSEFHSIDDSSTQFDNTKKLMRLRRRNRHFEEASAREVLRRFDASQFGLLIGAMAAWHRKVFQYFGPLQSNLWVEDVSMSIRARLIGKMAYLHRPLVLYRTHEESITNSGKFQTKDNDKKYLRRAAVFDAIAADLDLFGNNYAAFARRYRKSAGYLRDYTRWGELKLMKKVRIAVFFSQRIFRKWCFRDWFFKNRFC